MTRSLISAVIGAALVLAAAGGALAGPKVRFETTLGAFTMELNEEKAPKSVANFLGYVDAGFYDGVVFHRIIPNFMAQGGGFEARNGLYVQKQTRGQIANEAGNGLKNVRGSVAMARTSDPDSASSQFFVNFKDNEFLDREHARDGVGYAVFGQVIEGMDVIDNMAAAGTTVKMLTMRAPDGSTQNGPARDVPISDIVITSAKRVN